MKLALRMLDDSICQGCGHSSLLAHGFEGHGEYEVQSVTCHGCKALEKASGSSSEREPGQRRFARDLHDDPPEPETDDQDDDEPTDEEEL